MNRYQTNIIWLGLILIALNLVVNLAEVKSVIFNGASAGTTTAKTV
jgi:hypothetical protein